MIIKNANKLSLNNERKTILNLLEKGLVSIQPDVYLKRIFKKRDNYLFIFKNKINLKKFKRIFLIGFGKGAFKTSLFLENLIKNNLKKGFVIDVKKAKIKKSKIEFTKGTHPLPSKINYQFTRKIKDYFLNNLNKNDLVFVIVYGGGSALFNLPVIDFKKYIEVNNLLLKSKANIYEMNTIRKHLDEIKGGGLAKILYPAKVISLIVSDVPGNDLSFIASGPTVKDETTIDDAWKIIKKYKINKIVKRDDLKETVKDDKYFNNVKNILILSNLTILKEIEKEAKKLKIKSEIKKTDLKGEVSNVAKILLNEILKSEKNLLIYGGETTVKVKGKGKGGRNQELVLWFLKFLKEREIKKNIGIVSINSDGWDNTPYAGALGDQITLEKIKKLKIEIDKYLQNNDSYNFFKKVEDGIITGRLPTNVSDIILVFKF
ncbi:MAG: hypothetical protein C4348_02340 [Patescibacteria group bacterium]